MCSIIYPQQPRFICRTTQVVVLPRQRSVGYPKQPSYFDEMDLLCGLCHPNQKLCQQLHVYLGQPINSNFWKFKKQAFSPMLELGNQKQIGGSPLAMSVTTHHYYHASLVAYDISNRASHECEVHDSLRVICRC